MWTKPQLQLLLPVCSSSRLLGHLASLSCTLQSFIGASQIQRPWPTTQMTAGVWLLCKIQVIIGLGLAAQIEPFIGSWIVLWLLYNEALRRALCVASMPHYRCTELLAIWCAMAALPFHTRSWRCHSPCIREVRTLQYRRSAMLHCRPLRILGKLMLFVTLIHNPFLDQCWRTIVAHSVVAGRVQVRG